MNKIINKLIYLFIKNKIISVKDQIYYENIVYGILNLKKINDKKSDINDIARLFKEIKAYAESNLKVDGENLINYIAGILTPPPSVISKNFKDIEKRDSKKAFKYLHDLSMNNYYIKYDRLKKNIDWKINSKYGKINLTINLSKPEKSIYEITNAKMDMISNYPKCFLCKENIGLFLSGKNQPKQNLRAIDIDLGHDKFFMHYSPYEYYPEHLIINNESHKPMKIDEDTFKHLIDFVDKYPFYSIGSNADLPIVGGSILSHLHFQGGNGEFPIFNSSAIHTLKIESTTYEILNWPLAAIKITSTKKEDILKNSTLIMNKWKGYENNNINIFNKNATNNTITPFLRKNNGKYELFMLLRNNGTNKEFPNGYFHIDPKIWNIKQENIGIIEAIGQAILPGRLVNELKFIEQSLLKKEKLLPDELSNHNEWFSELKEKFLHLNIENSWNFILNEVGKKFIDGLESCNVFKDSPKELYNFLMGTINEN